MILSVGLLLLYKHSTEGSTLWVLGLANQLAMNNIVSSGQNHSHVIGGLQSEGQGGTIPPTTKSGDVGAQ